MAQVRDLGDGRVLSTFQHPGGVHEISWHPRESFLAAACSDGRIYLWEESEPTEPIRVLSGHDAEVSGIAFNHEGDLLASKSWDGTTILWEPLRGRQLLRLPGSAIQFGRDDRQLAFYRGNYAVGTWDLAAGHDCRTVRVHRAERGGPKGPMDIAISPDERLLSVACHEGAWIWSLPIAGRPVFLPLGRTRWQINLVDPETKRELATLDPPQPYLVTDIRISSRGRYVVASGENHDFQVWNLRSIRSRLAPRLERLWLRLTKRGDRYAFSTSTDGESFGIHGNLPWGDGSPEWLGLVAKSGAGSRAPEIDATIDSFEVRGVAPQDE